MDAEYVKILLSAILLTSSIEAILGANNTLTDIRQPRVNGRIVKLYSGTRPEPIFCSREGFQPDSANCAVFYRCIKAKNGKFTVFKFQCGPGTVYDPDTEICNFPQVKKGTECGGTVFEQFNEKRQIKDIDILSEFPLPISSKIPLYPLLTTVAKNAYTTAYPWTSTKTRQLKEKIPTASIWGETSTIPQKNYVPAMPVRVNSQSGQPCTSDGFMGDNENCRKFYRCVGNQRGGFIRYEFACSESTIWDQDAQSCNHPWAVQRHFCGGNSKINKKFEYFNSQSNDNEGKPTIQEQLQINYGTKVSQIQTQISNGTATQNQTQINYSETKNKGKVDCARQNQTQTNKWSAISQSQTQISNNKNGVQTQLQVDHTKQSSQMQMQVYESSSTKPISEGSNSDNDSGYGSTSNNEGSDDNENSDQNNSNECSESGFMGDKNNCKKFYRCVNNGKGSYTRYEFTCGEGTVWDSQIEACNHEWAVKACGEKAPIESATQSETTTSKRTTTRTTKLPDITSEPEEEDIGYGNQNQEPTQTTSIVEQKPSSKAPESVCESPGFFGDEKDCTKFYRCVDSGRGSYTKYDYKCGEGTVWDPDLDTCNHAWAVKRCGGSSNQKEESTTVVITTVSLIHTTSQVSDDGDSGYGQETSAISASSSTTTTTTKRPQTSDETNQCFESGFMGDKDDCKKFYRCVDNGRGYTRYEFTCGEGTVWDSRIDACNHAWEVENCGEENSDNIHKETTSKPSQSLSDEEVSSESTTKKEIEYLESSTTSSSSSTSQKPSSVTECAQEGFHGDENDCKKFYRCVDNGKGGYTKYDFTCGEGTIWDQEIQGCNHESGNCTKTTSTSQSTSENTISVEDSTSTSTSSSTVEVSTKGPVSSEPSSRKCDSEGFFANENDCKKFYRCVDNGKEGFTKYDFSCGEGTIWVQEIQACDHDDDVSTCNKQREPTQSSTHSVNPQQSTSEPTTSTTLSATAAQTSKPDKENQEQPSEGIAASNQCTSEGFYGNENECKRFYRCVDNGKGSFTKYDFNCGEGTAWDSDIQACNHISEVNSCQDSSPGSNQDQSKPVQQDEETPLSTSQTESTTKSSTSGSTTESSKPSPSKDSCTQEGYYGNSEDCTKFYRCVDDGKGGYTKYDFQCGEGTIWDQDVTTCNHPRDVRNPSCEQSANSESSTISPSSNSTISSSTESQSQSSSSSTESNGSPSNCSEESSSKKPINQVNCTKAGYYPNPDDCKKFYRCVDWDGDGSRFSVYHFECGEGTIWDPALDTCNHEESIYPPRACSSSQSQGAQGTTTSEIAEQSTQQTTEEPTTIEQTTHESTHSTTQQTIEQITQEQTTAQPTTQKQTTTQEPTSKQTTQQQTSSAQTTTEKTTTEQITTQQTTTEESTQKTTTQEFTEHTTTEKLEQTSTQKSTEKTTEGSDQESTTEQFTATEDGTEEHQSTTEKSTSSTDEQLTTESQEGTTESQESTTQGQASTTESQGNATESGSSGKECPETDEDQNLFVCPTSFRRHPKYCNLFYQCTEDDDSHDVKIAVFHCPNNTIYDETKTQCVEENKADKKCDGEMAQKRRVKRLDKEYKEPITVTKERLKCPAAGHYPFEKKECSPAFLKCEKSKSEKIRGFVYKCPEDFVYWAVSRRCEAKSKMRDCKHSVNNWSGRWEFPIERTNVALWK